MYANKVRGLFEFPVTIQPKGFEFMKPIGVEILRKTPIFRCRPFGLPNSHNDSGILHRLEYSAH